MKNSIKRTLSLLLAVALLCSALPQINLSAHAEDGHSGRCGANMTWTFNPNNGSLSIEGEGDMEDYEWVSVSGDESGTSSMPWVQFANGIRTISLPAGLTSIGSYAFYKCSSLASVIIPDGVSSIGECAFSQCSSIASAELPGSVKQIGDYAFEYCTSLVPIVIPDGVTKISYGAFQGCKCLTTVSIPNSVTSIWDFAFGFSGLTAVSIPGSVERINDWAFYYCRELRTVTFAEGIKTIEWGAFSGCVSLPSITLPASIQDMINSSAGFVDEEEHIEGFTVYGYANTGAQEYAECWGFPFVDLGEHPCANGHVFSDGVCTRCGKIQTASDMFSDVKDSAYYAKAVLWAVQNGITSGTGDGIFSPKKTCTREQVVTFLWKAAGSPEPEGTENPFADVKPGKYYYKPVLWAVENGVTSGASATSFGVGKTCTRAQIVTFLYNVYGK